MVSKQKAIQIDNDITDNKQVFYISLLGSDDKGKPKQNPVPYRYNTKVPYRYVFDIITKKFDFWNTNVQAKDVHDLSAYYKHTTNQDSSKTNIYQLCLHFLKGHSRSHFIFDEVPIIKYGTYTFGDLLYSLIFFVLIFVYLLLITFN